MLRLEVTCDESEGQKVEETLKKWGLPFYVEKVRSNGKTVLRFTAFTPEFAINDIADDLMEAIDMRRGYASVTWASVSGKSVKYATSTKSLAR